jgi:hypothetical protein
MQQYWHNPVHTLHTKNGTIPFFAKEFIRIFQNLEIANGYQTMMLVDGRPDFIVDLVD